LLIASRFVINMGFYTATEFLNYYVSDTLRAPDPLQTLGIILVIATVSGLLGNFPAGVLSDRVSKKLVIYLSAAVTGVAAAVFVITDSVAVAYATAIFFGAGYGAFAAVDWAFACNLLPDQDEAKHMGLWHIAFTAPQVFAPFLGGMIAYAVNLHFGEGAGYRAALALVVLYLLAGTLLLRPIQEQRPR
jgi:MFS family permease